MNTSTMDSTASNPRPQPVPLDGSPGIERPFRLAFLITLVLGSLSMLAAIPGTASAQNVQRLENCFTRTGDKTNGYSYTNNCSHAIGVSGHLHGTPGGARTCVGLTNESIAAGGTTYRVEPSHLGGTVCFQYHNARTHYRSGYPSCDTVLGDVTDCGTGDDLIVRQTTPLPDGTIVLSSTTASLIESGSAFPLRISLTADDVDDDDNTVPPVSEIVINLTSENPDIDISPASLTFSTTNYGTVQNLSIRANADNNGVDETGTVNVTAATTSGLHLDAATITFSVTDDNQEVTVEEGDNDDKNNPTLDEDETRTFNIHLGRQPIAGSPETVTVASSDDGAISVSSEDDSDTSDDAITLVFTSTNYEMDQQVEITAEDDTDGTSESGVTITFSADKAADVTRSLNVTDDDGSIEVSSAAVTAMEGGTGTFTVDLGAPPASSATLSVTSGATASATVSPATLTFSDDNYDEAQTVTVTGVEDSDGTDGSATITIEVSGNGYTASDATKTVTVEDDDGAINVSSADVSIVEGGGSTGTFTVTLAAPPASSAVLSVTSDDTAVGTFAPPTLTFSDDNYSTAQTVTITAVDDEDGTDGAGNIELSVTSGYRADDASKDFDVVDDDGSIVFSDSGTVAVMEREEKTFDVSLGAPPASSVSISVDSVDALVATVSPDRLTFTNQNYDTAQTVTVTGSRDKDYDDDSTDITFTVDDLENYRVNTNGNYSDDNDTVKRDIDVEDSDKPPAGRIMIRKTTDASILEGSAGIVWGISLSTDNPTDPIIFDATVSLTVGGLHPGAVTVSPTTLTFLPMNPSKEQLITIVPVDDNNYDDQSVSIGVSASGGIKADSQDIQITVIDDDTPPSGTIVLNDTGLLMLEEGNRGTFTVKLGGTIPTLDANLSLDSSDTGAIRVSPTNIVFGSANSTMEQRVTVTAVDDSNYDDESISIVMTISGGLAAPSVTKLIEVMDDDIEPMMVLSDQRLSLGEDQSTTINVNLNQQTPVPVNVSISTSSPDIVVVPSSFSFEPSQWNTPRPVSVYVRADGNRRDDFGIITFTATANKLGSPFENVIFELPIVMTEVTAPPGEGGEPSPPTPTLSIQSHVLAIPPPSAQDQANVRIWCRHRQPCTVAFECSAQEDGMFMEGQLAQPIPSMGTVTLSATEIAGIIGGSWEGKGRLGCALISDGDLVAQVWTRSGDGVLINNSATLRSVDDLVDIHDIPAPDSSDISNIRIRCPTEYPGDCQNMSLKCHDNDGMPYTGFLGTIERGAVFHMQTADLSEIIVHRWQGSELFCQVSGSRPFTVQVLTRTGGGGALVNNSARGGLM